MKELTLTVTERRRLTRNSIFRYIYNTTDANTSGCVSALNLSPPTVYQNLSELVDAELVCYGEELRSTGGRRARVISVVDDARLAVGISITEDQIRMLVANLRLRELAYQKLDKPRITTMAELGTYVANCLERFLSERGIEREKILGVGIALPAVIDSERERLMFAPTLHMDDTDLSELSRAIPYRVFIENDGTSGGLAEWFALREQKNIAYITLEDCVGGAVLANGAQYAGDHRRSGEFGHMCIHPGGLRCSCGKLGCLEAYCSARRISSDLGITLDTFFHLLSVNSTEHHQLWDDLLQHLALGIANIRMAFDCDIVLGGFLAPYMEPFMPLLKEYVAESDIFEHSASYLRLCKYPTHANALGAALHFILEFIDGI